MGGGRIGAIATQAFVNPLYGVDGMRLLQEGRSAVEIIATLTAADEEAFGPVLARCRDVPWILEADLPRR